MNPVHNTFFGALRERGVDPSVLDTATGHTTREDGGTLTDALLELGVGPSKLNAALQESHGGGFNPRPPTPEPRAIAMLTPEQARSYKVVPLSFDPVTRTSTILVPDALDEKAQQHLADLTQTRVHPIQTHAATLRALLFEHYAPERVVGEQGDSPPTPADRAALLDEDVARQYSVAPLRVEGRALVVAAANDAGATLGDDLRLVLNRPVRLERVPAHEVTNLVSATYGAKDDARSDDTTPDSVEEAALRDNVVIKTVHDILLHARTIGASDVHIDPRNDGVAIRIRRDGILTDYMTLPKSRERPIVARVKVLAGLNIADSLKAQDGRIRLREPSLHADLRVGTQPTTLGEKVTIRLLREEDAIPELEDLGMSDAAFARFQQLLNLPQGMILVSGPTGSGKSSTLFSFLKRVHTPEVNTLTIEDPVEYELEGINQTQVNPKAGVTFPAALRAFVRHDPDIILVGEMRDAESARLATEAAITGHLVLSTVHTNDSASTITRVIEMGVPPYLLADALKASLAQRLMRKVCSACAVPDQPSDTLLDALQLTRDGLAGGEYLRGEGCDHCRGTGYDGRTAIHELLLVSPEIEEHIFRRDGRVDIAATAARQGTRSLREDALDKARQGITTLDEVLRRTSY